MNYREAREYITEKEKLGSVMGLDTIRELLNRLDNPEKQAPVIHIAGTNGKGSILAFVEETLVEAGINVGRYISPTIYNYRERWRHNKTWVSSQEAAEAISAVAEKAEAMVKDGLQSPTAFEIETAAAFWLFRKWNCDIVLVECGMGGRLDATNVFDDASKTINVLASISFDHMAVLGDTLEKITNEKLGIVRDGSTLISYPQCEEVRNIVADYVNQHEITFVSTDKDQLNIKVENVRGAAFTYKGKDYRISVGGEYQILNAITAIEVLKATEAFIEGGISDEIISQGLMSTAWDGRFTVAHIDPLVVIDGAHNEDAWLRLRESVDKYFPNEKLVYIMGVFADKEYDKMIDILAPTMDLCYTVRSKNPRALSPEELSSKLRKKGVEARSVGDVKLAIDWALDKAKPETKIIICGTLSITGTALKYMGRLKI